MNELNNNEAAIISVKDELSGTFMQPIFIKGKEWKKQALRIFEHNINTIPLWKSNPSDYSMYMLGVFNEESGMLIRFETEKLANGRSVLKE